MFHKPEILRLAQEMATHSAARQTEIARNVANADTPGYRAKDLPPFADVYAEKSALAPIATRPGHIEAGQGAVPPRQAVDLNAEPSPNGNTVSLEAEIRRSAEVRHDHDLALAVYKSSLDLMRTVVGRGR